MLQIQSNQKITQFKKQTFGNKVTLSQNNLKSTLAKDLIQINQVISFKGKDSTRIKKAQDYIGWVNNQKGGAVYSLKELDPDRLVGITDGLKTFENLSIKDLYLLAR